MDLLIATAVRYAGFSTGKDRRGHRKTRHRALSDLPQLRPMDLATGTRPTDASCWLFSHHVGRLDSACMNETGPDLATHHACSTSRKRRHGSGFPARSPQPMSMGVTNATAMAGSGSRGVPIGATATALFTTGQASIAVPTWLIAQVRSAVLDAAVLVAESPRAAMHGFSIFLLRAPYQFGCHWR
jgi:hypothetical protein